MTSTYTPQPGTIPCRIYDYLRSLPEGSEVSSAELCDRLGLDISGPLGSYMITVVKHGLIKADTRPVRGMARKTTFWSLGNGKPPAPATAEADEEDDDAPLVRKPRTASAWTQAPASVFDLAAAAAPAASSEVEEQEVASEPAQAPQPGNVLGWATARAAEQVDPVGPEEMADAVLASASKPVAAQPSAQQLDDYFKALNLADEQPEDDPFVCALWSDGRLQLQRGGTELALLSVDETRALLHYLERVCAVEVQG